MALLWWWSAPGARYGGWSIHRSILRMTSYLPSASGACGPRMAGAALSILLALDPRGYNLSDQPRGVEHYEIDQLTGDAAALIRALGLERAREGDRCSPHDGDCGAGWPILDAGRG